MLTVPIRLDDLAPRRATVGYGTVGRYGELGYEGDRLTVGGQAPRTALSTHPPARLVFDVPADARRFRAVAAMADDCATHDVTAEFQVVVDGRRRSGAHVRAGGPAVPLSCDVHGARVLELRVDTDTWAHCHAVWVEPMFDDATSDSSVGTAPTVVVDPLGLAEVHVPGDLPVTDRHIVTVASAGFEPWLDGLLVSLHTAGGCAEVPVTVLSLGGSAGVAEVAHSLGATTIDCTPLRPLGPASKAIMYAAGRIVPAERMVLLDADMVVLGPLAPLFDALDALPGNTLLACCEGNDHGIPDLAHALDIAYGGGADPPFFRRNSSLGRSRLVINDGLLAGRRGAIIALERSIASLDGARAWMDRRPDIGWRNQFVANVAAARASTLVELDPLWNVQLHVQPIEVDGDHVSWRGQRPRIAHFSGVGKSKHIEWRQQHRDRHRPAATLGHKPWRATTLEPSVTAVPSMLSVDERRLLHWLARHHATPGGRIVDGGSFLGGSTAALASGLAARTDADRMPPILSYDRFEVEPYTLDQFGDALGGGQPGDSFQAVFEHNISPWAHHVDVRAGDIRDLTWTDEPIDVLFLDIVKSWEINDVVTDQLLPALVPGRSVIVQQDYLWGEGPWTHIMMELLHDSVRRLDAMPNGSVAYLLVTPVPDAVIGLRLREALTGGRMRQLMDRAVQRWIGEDRDMLLLARAVLEAELGRPELTTELIADVAGRHPAGRVAQCAASLLHRYAPAAGR